MLRHSSSGSKRRRTPQEPAAQELLLITQERDLLRHERDRLAQQVDVLLTLHQTTQQQLPQAQQLLHEMQHRYDCLLEAPRTAPVPTPGPPVPITRADTSPPGGDLRRRIVTLLREHPEGLTPAEIRTRLQVEKRLSNTCIAMLRDGLLRRVGCGTYVKA